MQAIETTATFTENGQLQLDEPLKITHQRVRVIVLVPDDNALENEECEDDSIETIREGLYQGWQDVLTRNTHPIAQLWENVQPGREVL